MQNEQQQREQRREKIRKKKRQRLIVIAALVLIVVLLVVAVSAIVRAIKLAKREPMEQIGPTVPAQTDVVSAIPLVYDYSQPVPAGDAVADSAFANTLFVGDARLGGFTQYGMLSYAEILSSGSASVDKVLTMDFDGTTLQSRLNAKQYDAVYLSLGINELGWNYANTFIEYYSALVDTVRQLQPAASIYVQLIIPVSSGKSGSHSYINNTRIEQYNALIRRMATEKEVYCLDLSAAMCDESGFLLISYHTDGVHFSKAGVEAWYEYLKTHSVQKENYSN